MKKTLLSLALLSASFITFAQRTVDWSVETILQPTQLNSTETAGTTFTYTVVCKNNSATDTIFPTDTFGIQILAVGGSQTIFAIPNTTSIALRVIGRTVNPGDTVHMTGGYNVGLRVNTSGNINFVVSSEVLNRMPGIGLNRETTTTITNNTKTKSIVWYNFQGWGVNVNEIENNLFSVYPNPAKDLLNIQTNISNIDAPTSIQLIDLTGKVVLSENIVNFNGKASLNTSSLSKGIYVIKLINGTQIHTSKVTIN